MSRIIGTITTVFVVAGMALLLAGRAHAQGCLITNSPPCCLGDCNDDLKVTAGELTKIICIILNCSANAVGCTACGGTGCANADKNGNGTISAGELTNIYADILNNVQFPNGCAPTPTAGVQTPATATNTPQIPTPTPTNTPVTPATATSTPVTPATATSTPVTPATATPSRTPPPPSATASATPTTAQSGVVTPNVCGNRTPEPGNGEDCDNGGTCVGGDNAGTACNNETQCTGNGVCDVGTKYGTRCASSGDCAGAKCVHCKTFGGNGCSANCTTEKNVAWNLVPGTLVTGNKCKAGTSCASLFASLNLNLPLSGSQTMVIGKKGSDGMVPFVTRADSVVFNAIPVGTLACACVRGVAAKSCGGYLFETDGSPATDCTFDDTCAAAGKPPCVYVNGSGNAASGVISCGTGNFSPVNAMTTQDAGGVIMPPPPTPTPTGVIVPPVVTLSGSGATGSAVSINSIRLGQVQGLCTGADPAQYGVDLKFCTDDDPESMRGAVSTVVTATGTTGAKLFNNSIPGFNMPPDPTPAYSVTGHVFDCTKLLAATPKVTGAGLASAFCSLSNTTPGNGVVTNVQYAQ